MYACGGVGVCVCVFGFQSQNDDESHQSKDTALKRKLRNACKTVARPWKENFVGFLSVGLRYRWWDRNFLNSCIYWQMNIDLLCNIIVQQHRRLVTGLSGGRAGDLNKIPGERCRAELEKP